MSARRIIVTIVAIVLVLAVSVATAMMFIGMKENMTPPKQKPTIRKVESELVKYESVESKITGTGRVLSQYSVDVISEVQGKLLQGETVLRPGTNFKQGQLIAKIYSKDAYYNMKSRKSSFLNALANILPDIKIDYSDSYEKWIEFFNQIDIEKELPSIPKIDSDQEKVFLSSRGVLREYYSIKADEERLRKYKIIAPFSGAIQDVFLEVGSVANPGSRIAKIIKTGALEIEVPVKVEDAKWIKINQKATLKIEKGKIIGSGRIVRKSSFVDPNNQSINIYVVVEKELEPLFAGQYLQLEFSNMVIANAMEIPRNATFNNNEVFISDSGYLDKKEINILKINEKTIVFNGLEEGIELIVEPLANAKANTPVQTQLSNFHAVKSDTLTNNPEPHKGESNQ